MRNKLLAIAIAPLAFLTIEGCGDDHDDGDDLQNPERLQALLRDAPLTQVPPRAASGAPGRVNLVQPGTNPIGVRDFNDCNTSRTEVKDAQFTNTAFRSVGVTCPSGIDTTQGV